MLYNVCRPVDKDWHLIVILLFFLFLGFSIESSFSKELPYFVSWHPEIHSAKCKVKKAPSIFLINSYLKNLQDVNVIMDINGVELEDKLSLINAFKLLTTATDWLGKPEKKRQLNFDKRFQINPECKKVICAVKKIWKKELALKFLYIATRFKISPSEYRMEARDVWRVEEIDDVLIALEDMPQTFYDTLSPIKRPKQITHYLRGKTLPGHSKDAVGWATITFYDNWFTFSNIDRQYFVLHEFGHNLSKNPSMENLDESQQWMNIGGWIKDNKDIPFYKIKKYKKSKEKNFISGYSKENPVEDFAESVAAYRYIPKKFFDISEDKYNYLKKNVFKNLEFNTEEQCLDISDEKLKIVSKRLVGNRIFKNDYLADELMKCEFFDMEAQEGQNETEYSMYNCLLKYVASNTKSIEDEILKMMRKNDIPFHQINYEKIKHLIIHYLTVNTLKAESYPVP